MSTDPVPTSSTLLYHTLVHDGALPPGFQQEFEALSAAIEGVTAREAAKRQASKFDAALFRSEELRHKTRAEKTVVGQLVQAATVRPRKYRARYLRAQFQGPPLEKTLRTQKGTARPRSSQTSSEEPSR